MNCASLGMRRWLRQRLSARTVSIAVGAQLVGDQQYRRETLLLEQLAHQPQRRPTVASALDQHERHEGTKSPDATGDHEDCRERPGAIAVNGSDLSAPTFMDTDLGDAKGIERADYRPRCGRYRGRLVGL